MAPPPAVHRPGKLKQVNKPYKSKHATKNELKRKAGRTAVEKGKTLKSSVGMLGNLSKQQRKNQAKQIRKMKKDQTLHARRIGSSNGPPKLVGVLSLGQGTDVNTLFESIVEYNLEDSISLQNGAQTI